VLSGSNLFFLGVNIQSETINTWTASPSMMWNVPDRLKEFQNEHKINLGFFKGYIKSRVRTMRRQGRPLKLIEYLQSGKEIPEDLQAFQKYEDNAHLIDDLIAHMTINLGILKQIGN